MESPQRVDCSGVWTHMVDDVELPPDREVGPLRYYPVVNDLIGGWDVSIHDKPVSEHGPDESTIAWGLTKKNAITVARVLTMEGVTVHQRLEELGIDRDRLKGVMDSTDNWGGLVHAFEALTVMGVVLASWPVDSE